MLLKGAGAHLYTVAERVAVKEKYGSFPRIQLYIPWPSGVQHTNHEATAPPSKENGPFFQFVGANYTAKMHSAVLGY